MKIVLCGNPNVGKTTLFNRLTRSDEPVGNWHGVTVDVRSKRIGADIILSDLPGAYSLSAYSGEEEITRGRILHGEYDVVLYVAEVNNLRRNLYMFMQIAEMSKRIVLIVNMMDEARGKVDLNLLSKRLGIPVVGTSQKYHNPKSDIIAAVNKAVVAPPFCPEYLHCSKTFALAKKIACVDACKMCADAETLASTRYSYIDRVLCGVVRSYGVPKRTLAIDKIVLGKAALPIFFAVMTAMFVITFEAGKPLSELIEKFTRFAADCVPQAGLPDWIIALIKDGIISGAGSVLVFLPQVVLLFGLTAVLQDSGYMSRVAFVTDGFFKKFGLNGRAAFSVILGFGCSATAVLSTRGIAGEQRQKRTALSIPFCPCSARLTVFTALCAYFGFSGFAVAAMYVLGFVAALAVLKVSAILSANKSRDFGELIMEMPPYRIPQLRRVLSVVMRNILSFFGRVGSVVLAIGLIMWVLCNFSVVDGFSGGCENSIMRTFAGFICPLFTPLGFGNWRAVTALISGVAAKETVVSVIGGLGGMQYVFADGLQAMSFMIFTCLYVPCVATLSALYRECGGSYVAKSVIAHTALAYVASLVFYRSALMYVSDPAGFLILTIVAAIATIIVVMTIVCVTKMGVVKLRR